MLKKIRCIYWKQRDKGKGNQCILVLGMAVFLILFFVVQFIRISVHTETHRENVSGTAVSEASVSGSSASGDAVSGEAAEADEEGAREEFWDSGSPGEGNRYPLDTGGISSLAGFMSDTAYEELVSKLMEKCRKKQIRSIRRLDYQKVSDTWQVTAYLLASDRSVFRLEYNLKNSEVRLTGTSLTEKDVSAMKKADEKKEADKLEKERESVRKKLAKGKKKSKNKK